MRVRQLVKLIQAAQTNVLREISGNASGGHIAAALAGEGYAGGYNDALSDMLLLLSDVPPRRRNYWEPSK